MTFTERVIALALIIGMTQLIEEGTCRAVYHTGSATETEVTNFEFIQRLGNPCGIERQERPVGSAPTIFPAVNETFNRTLFYQSMIIALDQGLEKLHQLTNADPDLPTCDGARLDSLPSLPSLDSVDETGLFREMYKSGIFLAAHLHIMGLDRQLSFVGVNDLRDEEVDEEMDDTPSWRILRCGNESDSFLPNLEDLTVQMENIICTVVSSASLEQRASFRRPFNRLTKTTFYRYHSSCSTLQTRDCLVIREVRATLSSLSDTFNRLLNQTEIGINGSNDRSLQSSAYTIL